jgi:hypothetical protein
MPSDLGVFSHRLHEAELEQIRRGDFRQVQLLTIDLSAAGFPQNGGARGLFEVECNGLLLLARTMDVDGLTELVSSVAATSRIYVRINHPQAPWLPFSLIAGSLDLSSVAGTIFRFWIRIPQATAAAKFYIAVLKGISIGSAGTCQGPSIAGYGAPGQTDPGSGGGTGPLSGGGAVVSSGGGGGGGSAPAPPPTGSGGGGGGGSFGGLQS